MMKPYLLPFLITVVAFLLILMLTYDPAAEGTAPEEPQRARRDDWVRLNETLAKNIRTEEIYLKPAGKSDRKEILSIPRTALFEEGEGHFVFLALPGPAFRRVPVKLGRAGGAGFESEIEIDAGLTPGNRIVTDGVLLLRSLSLSRPDR